MLYLPILINWKSHFPNLGNVKRDFVIFPVCIDRNSFKKTAFLDKKLCDVILVYAVFVCPFSCICMNWLILTVKEVRCQQLADFNFLFIYC